MTSDPGGPGLLLDRTAPRLRGAPVLDDAQRAVVDHRDGPLLVLAGPGTGKTTTLVETLVARLGGPEPLPAGSVLALTFGRRAAEELRDRVAARLGGGPLPIVSTFHSYAYALLRAWSDPEAFAAPVRLLSGPEQELRVREVLTGSVSDGRLAWPPALRRALGTAGLAAEIRAVLARARTLGLDPDELADLGRRDDVAGWEAVGQFAGEYLDVMDAEGVADYAELLHRAAVLAGEPHVRSQLREQLRLVVVDEYQDTDPAQVRLLRALVGPATTLIAVGDPDQSIYAFRGADVGGILRFRDRFRAADGSPARLVVLDRTRRFGPVLRGAATSLLGSRGLPGLSREELHRHRNPVSVAADPGVVAVVTVDDESALVAHVAAILRRARLESLSTARPLAWSDMAVIVRSGVRQIPRLARALVAASVPVEVAGDELPLKQEPAVAALLCALDVAADGSALTIDAALSLLTGPIGAVDPADLRRLGRALRDAARAEGTPVGQLPPSAQAIRDALAQPAELTRVDPVAAGPALSRVRAVAGLLAGAATMVAAGEAPDAVLWRLWAGEDDRALRSGWPARLQAAALRGGPAGRRADRDLDAVCALFDTAARAADRAAGVKGVGAFLAELEAQAIPAETLAERGLRGEAVRVLTAHRAKGLEWRLVVVAGAQEGTWPDLRPRGSLLLPDRLTRDGLADPPHPASLLAEERRLFYVACTRARERLVVVSVASAADDGDTPSRFLADLDVAPEHRPGRPARPLSGAAIVADLRRAAVDPDTPPPLRGAAIARLARLASARDADSRPLLPAADPATWWGTVEPTPGAAPVRDPLRPVALSASALAGIIECPLRWFLSREARGQAPRTTALGFGSVVHVLADRVGRRDLPAELAGLDDGMATIWDRLEFESDWVARRERREARAALARFLVYHRGGGRELVATEAGFDVVIDAADGAGGHEPVRLRGALDRVEADDAGRLYAIDLKTIRRPGSAGQVRRDPQLAVYQTVLATGAITTQTGPGADVASDVTGRSPEAAPPDPEGPAGQPAGGPPAGRRRVGGAALVQLRVDAGDGSPKVQEQPPLEPEPELPGDPTWIEIALADAARRVRAERFDARPGQICRYCEFTRVCPAQRSGAPVGTS